MHSVTFMPPLSAVSERRRKKDDAAREARRNERKGRIFSPFWESPVRVPLLPSTSSTSSFSSSSTSPSVSHHSSARHAERALPAAQATGWGPSEDLYTGRALASSRPGLSLNIPRSVPRPARDSSVDVSAIGELEQRKHSLETEIASLAARERQLKEDTARFSAEHAAWSEALSALRQEHDAARASLETEQQSLERAWHDRTEAEDAAARERERLRMARDAAELAQQEYQRKEAEGRRQLEHLQAQIDDAQRITAANARSAGRRLQDDVAKAQVELKTAKSETARAQTELRKILEDTQKARVELQQEQQGVKKAAVEKDVLAESLKKARQHVAAAEVAARDARMQASQEQDHLAAVQRDVSRARVEHLAAEERARAARASAEHEEARARRMKELEDRRAMHAQHASHGPIQDESTAAPKETQTDSRLIFSAPAGEMLPPLLPPMPAPSSRTTTTSASETGSAPAKAVRRPRVRDLFADWDEQTRAESSRVAQVSTESSPTSTLRAVPGSFGLHETAPATPGSGAHTTADAPVIGTASENVAGVLPKHGDHHVLNARSASSSSAPLGRGLVPVPAGQDPPSLSLQRPPTLPSAAEAKCEWDDRRHAPKPPLFAPKKSQSMFDKAKSLVFGASSSQPEAQSSPVEETHAWRRPSATGDLLQLDVQQIPATRAHLPAADMLGNPWATSGDIGGIGAEVESGYDVGNGIASHGTRATTLASSPQVKKTRSRNNAAMMDSATEGWDGSPEQATKDTPLVASSGPHVVDTSVSASEERHEQEPPKPSADVQSSTPTSTKSPALTLAPSSTSSSPKTATMMDSTTEGRDGSPVPMNKNTSLVASSGRHVVDPSLSASEGAEKQNPPKLFAKDPAPTPTNTKAPAPASTPQTASAFEDVLLELKPAEQVKWRLAVLEVIQPLVYAMPAGGDEYSAQDAEAA